MLVVRGLDKALKTMEGCSDCHGMVQLDQPVLEGMGKGLGLSSLSRQEG